MGSLVFSFPPLFLQIFFLLLSLSPFTLIFPLFMCSLFPEALLIFLYFFFAVQVTVSTDLSLSLLSLSSALSNLLMDPSTEFLFQLLLTLISIYWSLISIALQLQNFHLVLFYNFVTICTLPVWWDTIIIASFNSVCITGISSSNIPVFAYKIWHLSPLSPGSFYPRPHVWVTFSCFFFFFNVLIFCWKMDMLDNNVTILGTDT